MKVLERERELAQRQVLLNRWTAYDEVPVKVKRVLGLLGSDGEDEVQ